jgi:probable rRNA maturation factor
VTDAAERAEGVAVRRAVRLVLDRERVGAAVVDVTMLSGQRMRALNRRAFGHDRATDVLAFGMRHGDTLVGDIYLCPPVARRAAARYGIPLREEILRLAIHGTLHAIGYDHPVDAPRERSPMWRRQERYLAALRTRAR